MIKDIFVGDITRPENPDDIIIGMNSALSEVNGIGRPFVEKIRSAYPIELGTVLSFEFDTKRHLHMIVCHHLGKDGWVGADMHVRFGMDYLWQRDGSSRNFSIVKIGTGRVGIRDHADAALIHTAMATSHLPVNLFLLNPRELMAEEVSLQMPSVLRLFRRWDLKHGEMELAA